MESSSSDGVDPDSWILDRNTLYKNLDPDETLAEQGRYAVSATFVPVVIDDKNAPLPSDRVEKDGVIDTDSQSAESMKFDKPVNMVVLKNAKGEDADQNGAVQKKLSARAAFNVLSLASVNRSLDKETPSGESESEPLGGYSLLAQLQDRLTSLLTSETKILEKLSNNDGCTTNDETGLESFDQESVNPGGPNVGDDVDPHHLDRAAATGNSNDGKTPDNEKGEPSQISDLSENERETDGLTASASQQNTSDSEQKKSDTGTGTGTSDERDDSASLKREPSDERQEKYEKIVAKQLNAYKEHLEAEFKKERALLFKQQRALEETIMPYATSFDKREKILDMQTREIKYHARKIESLKQEFRDKKRSNKIVFGFMAILALSVSLLFLIVIRGNPDMKFLKKLTQGFETKISAIDAELLKARSHRQQLTESITSNAKNNAATVGTLVKKGQLSIRDVGDSNFSGDFRSAVIDEMKTFSKPTTSISGELLQSILDDFNIGFDDNLQATDPSAVETFLDVVLELMADEPGLGLKIIGIDDGVSEAINGVSSPRNRAQILSDLLRTNGISESRLQTGVKEISSTGVVNNNRHLPQIMFEVLYLNDR